MRRRCIICKVEFDAINEKNIVCEDRLCKKRRHKETWRNASRNRSVENRTKRYILYLQEKGYSVLPIVTSNYRIILEPINES